MVKRLETVVQRVEKLSEDDQEALAAIIEAELEDEEKWQLRFSQTPATLSKIAEQARKQYDAGECSEL